MIEPLLLDLPSRIDTERLALRTPQAGNEDNAPSRGVADRCGFALEGTLRSERRAPDGTLRNTCIYARFPLQE